MGAEQNVETIKAMYDAFGGGDVDAILESVTDDVDWSTDAAIESAPWYAPSTARVRPQLFRRYRPDRPGDGVRAPELRG